VTDAPKPPAKWLRFAGFVLGVSILGVVAALGWRSLEEPPDGLLIAPLAVLLSTAMLSLGIVTMEFRLVARALDVDVGWPRGLNVTILGTAANLLPLPGAALTRIVVLRKLGAKGSDAVKALTATAGVWLGAALLVAGASITAARPWAGILLVVAGAFALGTGATILRRVGSSNAITVGLLGTEVALISTGILRLWLALRVVNLDGTLLEVAGLSAAAPASAAVGFMPGGIGIRESLAAALGSLSGLGAAEAAIGATIDRAAGLIMLVPLYVFATWRQRASEVS